MCAHIYIQIDMDMYVLHGHLYLNRRTVKVHVGKVKVCGLQGFIPFHVSEFAPSYMCRREALRSTLCCQGDLSVCVCVCGWVGVIPL